ncbi:unnamed protein product [Heligmosomoides polygyrus]|uniref:glucuronosyltransferase n=1 Tax=Heligmosomoides polygyrus TaxID=6339 RepID=A0A183G8L8_HELPZ|nr:unnamed protein product [Heligmosomoides polygyrus]
MDVEGFPKDQSVLFYGSAGVSHCQRVWHPENFPCRTKNGISADKRVSLFITHAGMNSVLEATQFGKPMVAIPLFSDQIRNAKTVKRRGLAVMISRSDLNKDTLTAAIRKALSDSTIAHKAAKVASYLDGRPALARNETAKWVRLVAEEGLMDHLILQSRNMSFIQYYNIDVFAYLLAQLILVLWLLLQVGRLILCKSAALFKKGKVE